MKIFALAEQLRFSETRPISEAILGDSDHRILRFCLKPHQLIAEHRSPHSSVVLIGLQGTGLCRDGEGHELRLGPLDLIVLAPGEAHSLEALEEDFVFVALLHGVPGEHEPVGSLVATS